MAALAAKGVLSPTGRHLLLGGSMFSTQPQAVQQRVERQLEYQAHNVTQETQRQVESQLETRTVDLHRQTIEGKGQEIQVNERAGASKQQVIDQAQQNIMGSVDFELSKLKPPSFLSDRLRREWRK